MMLAKQEARCLYLNVLFLDWICIGLSIWYSMHQSVCLCKVCTLFLLCMYCIFKYLFLSGTTHRVSCWPVVSVLLELYVVLFFLCLNVAEHCFYFCRNGAESCIYANVYIHVFKNKLTKNIAANAYMYLQRVVFQFPF